MMMADTITYWDYLRVDDLLSLQGGLEGDDEKVSEDELHFIIVHQVFELWFKLVIRELQMARDTMAAPKVSETTVPVVVHHIRRVHEILKVAIDHFRVMETLTPQDFLAFRSKLGSASGFQSTQMREIEGILGLEDSEREAMGHPDPIQFMQQFGALPGGSKILERMKAAREGVSLREAVHRWLHRTPIHGSTPGDEGDEGVVSDFVEAYLSSLSDLNKAQLAGLVADGGDEAKLRARFEGTFSQARSFLMAEDIEESERAHTARLRAGVLFIESYRDLPLLAWPRLLIDAVVELEELFVIWRSRHARMVERVIGRRVGTGGSAGVDYLDQTSQYRIFRELWAVRTLLLPKDQVPPLKNPDLYDFASS